MLSSARNPLRTLLRRVGMFLDLRNVLYYPLGTFPIPTKCSSRDTKHKTLPPCNCLVAWIRKTQLVAPASRQLGLPQRPAAVSPSLRLYLRKRETPRYSPTTKTQRLTSYDLPSRLGVHSAKHAALVRVFLVRRSITNVPRNAINPILGQWNVPRNKESTSRRAFSPAPRL